MGAMDRFLEKLYDSTDHCRGSLSGLRDVQERTRVIRRQLEGALGDFGFAHRQPDHLGEQIEHTVLEDHIRERMIFQLGDELSVPVYVLTPRQHSGPLPAVLALHGHGYGSKEIVGLAPDGTADTAATGIHQHFAIQLVRRGMKVFAPELAGFGERRLARDYAEAKPCSCNTLSRHLIMTGRTLAGLRVYEATRMIDLMARLQDVDSERLGLMGFSGGGLVAAYASGLEERIKRPCCADLPIRSSIAYSLWIIALIITSLVYYKLRNFPI
ncbi:dienelactone hydrolase family protein [Paenibacillus sp. JCM 10914]|uniref:dienelactone hydrolase family protein n=1 Tax=Paenibacillus sp. JCM 10914 TaxID=1236974 RepID=UPI0003CC88F2|nr:alpha/beta hydrolase family protein [Paenibacillus sp. JCM 10914]GAE04442.1 hypothetical protein JCM10914_488 [Paenibacillus sp. JCM 10914]